MRSLLCRNQILLSSSLGWLSQPIKERSTARVELMPHHASARLRAL